MMDARKDEVLCCGSWFSQYLRVQVSNKHCCEELRVARAGSARTVMGENQDNPCTADQGRLLDF